jgi:hypothetical protein
MKKILIISLLFLSIAGFSQTEPAPKPLGSWTSTDSIRAKVFRFFKVPALIYGPKAKLQAYGDSLYFWNGSELFNLTAFVVYPETDPDFHAQVRDSSYLVLTDSIIAVLESYGFYLSTDSGYIRKMQTDTSVITYAEIGNHYDTSETQTLIGDSLADIKGWIAAHLQRIENLEDTTALHLDTLQSHNIRILANKTNIATLAGDTASYVQFSDTGLIVTETQLSDSLALKADIADSSLWSQTGNDITPKTATKVETDSIDVNVFELPNWKYYIDNDTLKTAFWNGATWVLIKKEYE